MMAWPMDAPSLGCNTRAMMSVVPPAVYGTITRMGFCGQVCANADAAPIAQAANREQAVEDLRFMLGFRLLS